MTKHLPTAAVAAGFGMSAAGVYLRFGLGVALIVAGVCAIVAGLLVEL